jgi:hypothetical protein
MSNGGGRDARENIVPDTPTEGKLTAVLAREADDNRKSFQGRDKTGQAMQKTFVVLAIAVAIAVGFWIYTSKRKALASERAVSAEGVKKDLVTFAHAERTYKASHGQYASLDELYSSGALKTEPPPRDGYTYSWGSSAIGFSVIARCQLKTSAHCPSFAIDQSMQLQQLP